MAHRRGAAGVVLLIVGGALASIALGWVLSRPGDPDVSAAAEPVVRDGALVDARTGDPWVPQGPSWSGFESACAQGWGYSGLDPLGEDAEAQQAALIASWGADTVRLPLNQDCWLGTRGAPVSDDFVERTPEGYRRAVGRFVEALHEEGLVVVLDLHSRKRIGSAAFGSMAMPDSESLAFWRSVAAQYADSPSVLFDAFHAPHSRVDARGRPVLELDWRCWSRGGCDVPVDDDRTPTRAGRATYEALGMDDLVDSIRRTGAEQPILLSGLDRANDLESWLEWAPEDDQLVAAFHAYDTADCGPTCWEEVIAPLSDLVPVLTTELGAEDPTDGWVADYLAFAEEHDIGSLLWVWAERPGDPMALVSDLEGTSTAWGELARRWWTDGLPGAG